MLEMRNHEIKKERGRVPCKVVVWNLPIKSKWTQPRACLATVISPNSVFVKG